MGMFYPVWHHIVTPPVPIHKKIYKKNYFIKRIICIGKGQICTLYICAFCSMHPSKCFVIGLL